MIATQSMSAIGWVVSGVGLVVGLSLLWRGGRGRRVGEEPRCARCGYNLIARASDRCPECGADVSTATGVVVGTRVRSSKMIAWGAALSIVASTVLSVTGWQPLRNFDWYTLKPTGFVLDDLASSPPVNQLRAAAEMNRRLSNGQSLSNANRDRLVDITSAAHKASLASGTPGGPAWLVGRYMSPWVSGELKAGRLDARRLARLLEDSQAFTADVPPTTVEGRPQFAVLSRRNELWGLEGYLTSVVDAAMSVDGGDPVAFGGNARLAMAEDAWGRVSVRLPQLSPGRHEISLVLRVRCWTVIEEHRFEEGKLLHDYGVTLKRSIQVVPTGR